MVLLTRPFSLSPEIFLFSQKLVTFYEYQVSVLFLLISIFAVTVFDINFHELSQTTLPIAKQLRIILNF